MKQLISLAQVAMERIHLIFQHLSCFIVAGTGQKVAKHGNYGASSISGASNVMEQMGYKFKNDNERLKKEVEEANICFLHAHCFILH